MEKVSLILSIILSLVAISAIIISNTKRFNNWRIRKQFEQHYALCPNAQKITSIEKTLELSLKVSTFSLGATIYNICIDALRSGCLDNHDREWIVKAYPIYKQAGGNSVVDDKYKLALELEVI